jgi:hypothetical protein
MCPLPGAPHSTINYFAFICCCIHFNAYQQQFGVCRDAGLDLLHSFACSSCQQAVLLRSTTALPPLDSHFTKFATSLRFSTSIPDSTSAPAPAAAAVVSAAEPQTPKPAAPKPPQQQPIQPQGPFIQSSMVSSTNNNGKVETAMLTSQTVNGKTTTTTMQGDKVQSFNGPMPNNMGPMMQPMQPMPWWGGNDGYGKRRALAGVDSTQKADSAQQRWGRR